MTILWIAIGGAIGAVGRFSIAGLVGERLNFSPLGTFAVNISGAFALGLFAGLGDKHFDFPPEITYLLATGVLGSYTTFSTLVYETIGLMERGHNRVALLYAAGSQLLGLLAVIVGLGTVHLW